ncbi:MAG TPA: glycosyltransferase [Bacteroidia bacterium]|nr:glycosyltransferase [Bacteroidia bacterium]HNT79081.1 glycosyltransferase [Bacteroidia bacterium]
MNQRKKILFLYFELAGYFTACIEHLVSKHAVEIHVVRYPVNSVAPFQFDNGNDLIRYYERSEFSQEQLIQFCRELNPDLIVCNGWSDTLYVETCKHFKNQIPYVLTFDNPWRNTFKQNIARFVSRLFLLPHFNQVWVPGEAQFQYALRLGFKESQIKRGLYCCDYNLFSSYYHENKELKKRNFPKRFLFLGRYTKLKGVQELWDAFMALHKNTDCEWELWSIGKGDLDSKFPIHPKIKNFGFVQPSELGHFIKECGVFMMPSQYEHWGVVLHEMTLAGLPVICSDTTSAADTFVEHGQNGFLHKACSSDSILQYMSQITKLSNEELWEMSKQSNTIGQRINFETWSEDLLNYISR